MSLYMNSQRIIPRYINSEEKISVRRYRRHYLPSFAMRWARRETFRLALRLRTTPRCAARMMTGSAALNAARAALRSPLWIASSTLRIEFRRSERRPLFTSVRRAITRVALRADLVLAITLSFAVGAPADARESN